MSKIWGPGHSSLIQQGKILFPRQGCEQLLQQLIGFGVEKHDDLVDAFTIIGHRAIEIDEPVPSMGVIYGDGSSSWTKLGDTSNDY